MKYKAYHADMCTDGENSWSVNDYFSHGVTNIPREPESCEDMINMLIENGFFESTATEYTLDQLSDCDENTVCLWFDMGNGEVPDVWEFRKV